MRVSPQRWTPFNEPSVRSTCLVRPRISDREHDAGMRVRLGKSLVHECGKLRN
jgi:hypothetical protein